MNRSVHFPVLNDLPSETLISASEICLFSKALQNSIKIENFHRILLGLFHEIHIFSSKKHQIPPLLSNCPIIFFDREELHVWKRLILHVFSGE